jgi:hypothetical protein
MSVSVSAIRACKSCFTLVIGMDRDLVITQITIKETKEGVLGEPF